MSNAHSQQAHHVLPLKIYFGVFGALLVLTAVTVGVSYMNLGPWAIYAALIVAMIKAGLVVGYFMHLKFDTRFHSLIFFGSLIFLAFFFIFVFFDLGARGKLIPEHDNFALRKDQKIERESGNTVTFGGPRLESGVNPPVLATTKAAVKPPSKLGGAHATKVAPSSSGPAPSGAAMAEAEKIFDARCSACHGKTGGGDGPGAAALNPKPRKLNDPAWQKSVTDAHIESIILRGGLAVGKSPLMPPNPDLASKPKVVKALRQFVRQLAK